MFSSIDWAWSHLSRGCGSNVRLKSIYSSFYNEWKRFQTFHWFEHWNLDSNRCCWVKTQFKSAILIDSIAFNIISYTFIQSHRQSLLLDVINHESIYQQRSNWTTTLDSCPIYPSNLLKRNNFVGEKKKQLPNKNQIQIVTLFVRKFLAQIQ